MVPTYEEQGSNLNLEFWIWHSERVIGTAEAEGD